MDWASCEPVEGEVDEEAFGSYTALLDGCRARGLLPVGVLHHLGHPPWLGDDHWLRLEAPARFGAWATAVGTRLGGRCRHWITVEQPNVVAVRGWLSGTSRPSRILAVGDVVRSLDHLLAAHVVAYGALHRLRPDAVVATTIAASPVYELGALLTDVQAARAAGVVRHEVHDWLGERRRSWYTTRPRPSAAEAAVRRMAQRAIPLDQALPRTLDALWSAPHDRSVDDLPAGLPGHDAGDIDVMPAPGLRHVPFRAAVGRAIEAVVLGGGGA